MVRCRSAGATAHAGRWVLQEFRQSSEDFKGPTHSVEFTFMKILTANKITYLEIRLIYYNMGICHFVKLPFFSGYFLASIFFW